MSKIEVPTTIQLAHFDMAGTTIDDNVGDICTEDCKHNGKPLPIMIDGFQYALKKIGVDETYLENSDCNTMFNVINKHRGAKKLDALYEIITELRPDVDSEETRWEMARTAHDHFIERGVELSQRVNTKKGVLDLYRQLQDGEIYVVTATGFPDDITNALVDHLGWYDKGVNLVVNANQAGGGRPQPHMINFALNKAGLLVPTDMGVVQPGFDYSVVMKVGDTVKDVQEGLGVGALTIATLEGTQALEKIKSKGDPHYVVQNTRDIAGLIDQGKIVLKSYKA